MSPDGDARGDNAMYERSSVRRRHPLLLAPLVVVLVAVVGYVGASIYVYDRLSKVEPGCQGTPPNDPTSFVVDGVDTSPYIMPAPRNVTFPARDDATITIDAWFLPVQAADAPTVILVHGLNGCKRSGENLLAAGMLHRAGLAALLIDLRDHGDSTFEDGRFAGGSDEYRDVLGAFDWLRTQGVPADRIGLLGFSLGAATAMIAVGEELEIAAVWADSSFGDIREAIRDELRRSGYPTLLEAGGIFAGKVLAGDDLAGHSPLDATAKLHGRPIFLTMGSEDDRIDPGDLDELAAAVRAAGGTVDVWQVQGARHTQALRLYPDEYEQRLVDFFSAALGPRS